MGNAALLPAKELLAQVGDFPVNIQILPLKIVQLAGQRKNFCSQRVAYFECRGTLIIIDLANFVGRGARIVTNANLNKLWCAPLKNSPKRDFGARARRWERIIRSARTKTRQDAYRHTCNNHL